ncbi:MAG: hypothetical protein V3V41_08670, partial [Candidatus Heimdallarchaeota archaeon]
MNGDMIKWNLSDYFESIYDSKVSKEMDSIQNLSEQFSQNVKGNLTESDLSGQQLKEWIVSYEKISERLFDLQSFAYLEYTTTSLDDGIKRFQSKVEEFGKKIKDMILFFELELNNISQDKFDELLLSPELSN